MSTYWVGKEYFSLWLDDSHLKESSSSEQVIKVMLRFYVGAWKQKSIYLIFEDIIPVASSAFKSFEILENARLSWLSLRATGRSWGFDRTYPVGLRT